jgi:hypothetical protein
MPRKNSPTPQEEQQQSTLNPRTLAMKSLQYVA